MEFSITNTNYLSFFLSSTSNLRTKKEKKTFFSIPKLFFILLVLQIESKIDEGRRKKNLFSPFSFEVRRYPHYATTIYDRQLFDFGSETFHFGSPLFIL